MGRRAREKQRRRAIGRDGAPAAGPSLSPATRPGTGTAGSDNLTAEQRAELVAAFGDRLLELRCGRCRRLIPMALNSMSGAKRDSLKLKKAAPDVPGYVCTECDRQANGEWLMRVAAAAGIAF